MSLDTWLSEFYPVPAHSAAVSDKEALGHALLKWTGLTKKNLAKHQVETSGAAVMEADDSRVFRIDSDSCALCHRYLNGPGDDCYGCPLFEARGVPCDQNVLDTDDASPYHEFYRHSNPNPMLKLIRIAIKRSKEAST